MGWPCAVVFWFCVLGLALICLLDSVHLIFFRADLFVHLICLSDGY